jgi:hypothetical protein
VAIEGYTSNVDSDHTSGCSDFLVYQGYGEFAMSSFSYFTRFDSMLGNDSQ